MSTTVPHGPLLTVEETAERLRLSEKTVRRMIAADLLPAIRVSPRAIRIDVDELLAWLYADRSLSVENDPAPASRLAAE